MRCVIGIRSDSDLFTYSFPWHPWKGQAIAPGYEILQYLKEAAEENGIDTRTKFNHRVDNISWCSKSRCWTVEVADTQVDKAKQLRCRYLLLATGYYDYDTPLQAEVPGISNFQGPVIHPQFWPKDVDYKGKEIVVIGSGATAITLVPTLGEDAAHVTMLQRSPTYIASVPRESMLQVLTKLLFPANWAYHIIRLQWISFMILFVRFSRTFPSISWAILLLLTRLELPFYGTLSPNFTPKYKPFDQNLCLTPNSEFFKTLGKGKTSIVTDTIEKVTARSIKLASGAELNPDIIITATGLRLSFGGYVKATVDGEPFSIPSAYIWKGCMLDGLPNCVAILGYFDASWTLGTDVAAKRACRLLNYAKRNKKRVFTPRSDTNMQPVPFTYLNATYVTTADGITPKAGSFPQWQPRPSYVVDLMDSWWGDITTDMDWE